MGSWLKRHQDSFAQLPIGDQKGGLPAQNLKPPVPFPTPIKWKVKTIGPPSGSAPQSPSGG